MLAHTGRAQPLKVSNTGNNRIVPCFLSVTEDRIVLGFFCSMLLFAPSDIPQEYPRMVILGSSWSLLTQPYFSGKARSIYHIFPGRGAHGEQHHPRLQEERT